MVSSFDECPQCGQDLVKLRAALDKPLSLCSQCRFPLALIANKYRIEKVLGEGGFGVVYLARHIRLKAENARVIKFIKPDVFQIKGMEERFYHEVQITSRLSQKDEHIVRIYDDFGEIPHVGHYYVMEMLRGHSLSDLLKHYKRKEELVPLDVCFHIMRQLLKAMYIAHQSQVLHRDLKPDNLFLVQHKEDPFFLKILDFGIAKPTSQTEIEKTQLTKGAIGTPYYMSPEQCQNTEVDARSDLYAIGCIFYELLVGHSPFYPKKESEASLLELLLAQVSREPIPPSSLEPKRVSPILEGIVLKSLEKDPDKRYTTGKEFLNALEEAISLHYPEGKLTTPSLSIKAFSETEQESHSPKEDLKDSFGYESTMLPTFGGTGSFEEKMPEPNELPSAQEESLEELSRKEAAAKEQQEFKESPQQEQMPLPETEKVEETDKAKQESIVQPMTPPPSNDIDTLLPQKAPKRRVQLIALVSLSVVGMVLFAIFLLPSLLKQKPSLASTSSTAKMQINKPPRHTKKTEIAPKHTPKKTTKKVPVSRTPSPRLNHKKKSPKAFRKVTKNKIAPKKRKNRKKQMVSRRSPYGCPVSHKKEHWIKLTVSPRKAMTRFRLPRGIVRPRRIKNGKCLAIRKKSELTIEASSFYPCTINIPFRTAHYRIYLRKEKLHDIEPEENYCLTP